MHYWSNQHFLRRILLAVDLAAGIAAFWLALLCRFMLRGLEWNANAYSMVLVLAVLLCILLNLYRRVRHRSCRLTEHDAVEIASELFKDRALQYIIIVLLLYALRTIDDISRLVLVLMFAFDVGISFGCRMALRGRMVRDKNQCEAEEHYFILTTGQTAGIARMRLSEMLSDNEDIAGMILVDPGQPEIWQQEVEKTAVPAGRVRLFVYLKNRGLSDAAVQLCRRRGIPVRVFQFADDLELPGSMVGTRSAYATIEYEPLVGVGEVFGVRFSPTDVETAVFEVLDNVASLSGSYICFSNVHTTVMAHNDAAYRDALNGSAYTFADGKPIARKLHSQGFAHCERVAGPDFMDAIFRATMDGRAAHYFYGSTPETIRKLGEELPKRYPGIRIAGLVSPPFRPETKEEDTESIAAMNESGADFIWIGLGAPKQELWMAQHRSRVNGVLLGVGAGFDFYAGTVKRAPKWMQKVGLEWLYRLFQDPKRLANRYIVTNAQYLWYTMKEHIKI